MTNQYPAAIMELRELGDRRRQLAYLRDRITELDTSKYAINSGMASAIPTAHGGTRYEDRLERLICDCDAEMAKYRALHKACVDAEAALATLSAAERTVLELCYIDRPSDWVAVVKYRLHIEQSQVYKIKNKALKKFSKYLNFNF